MVFVLLVPPLTWAEEEKGREAWWWDEAWWSRGVLEEVRNYRVETRRMTYKSGDIRVPVFLARPKGKKKFPGVMFVHGRRGLDELIELYVIRLAARGFIVFAPDLFSGHFISKYPIKHDYALEEDLNKGVDAFLKLPDIKGKKICTYSHTRGGYYTLKLAVTKKRQNKDVVCYVSYYPHWQDPNAPEPMQVYQYAPEINEFDIPALIFVGEKEQYHRKRVIDSSVDTLRIGGKDITYIVYPGVGRGFDFRPENFRTFADDLASKDAIRRAAQFIRKHLKR